MIPHAPKWHQRLGAFLLFISLRALLLTVRCRLRAQSEYLSPSAPVPVIFCIWHNRLALSMKIYFGFVRARQPAPRRRCWVRLQPWSNWSARA